jgi:hypothetical protein
MGCSQVVRQRLLVPSFEGSIPSTPALWESAAPKRHPRGGLAQHFGEVLVPKPTSGKRGGWVRSSVKEQLTFNQLVGGLIPPALNDHRFLRRKKEGREKKCARDAWPSG